MFIPLFSSASTNQKLRRRKGGGGRGSSTSTSSKSSKSGSKSPSSTISSSSKTKRITTSSAGSETTFWSSTYSNPRAVTPAAIPAGHLFASRLAGGGTRSQIFGTRTYGSGYAGVSGRGTAGRGFPFIFWPISWPVAALASLDTGQYLNNGDEYGNPTNTSRPGGQFTTATFTSVVDPATGLNSSTFRIASDNDTVLSLLTDLLSNCSSLVKAANNSTAYALAPVPEQVVQYYRASSIALSVDGYNNSATYASSDNAPDTPLPTNINLRLLSCLNQTIGLAAPLIDGAVPPHALDFRLSAAGLFLILWELIMLLM